MLLSHLREPKQCFVFRAVSPVSSVYAVVGHNSAAILSLLRKKASDVSVMLMGLVVLLRLPAYASWPSAGGLAGGS